MKYLGGILEILEFNYLARITAMSFNVRSGKR